MALMPALATSVLVRYIVQDDVAQLATAKRHIGKCVREGRTLFVPVTVTLELEWVLRSGFDYSKEVVMKVLSSLLSSAELTFESERALEVALQLYRTGSSEFADCLQVAVAAHAGAQPLWTFDKRAAKLSGAALVGRTPVLFI